MNPTLNEKEAYWHDHLIKQENSQLSVIAYADQNRLSDKTLYHWKKRLKNKGITFTKQNNKSVFSKVKRQTPAKQTSIPTFTIILPNAIRIEMTGNSPIPAPAIKELMSL